MVHLMKPRLTERYPVWTYSTVRQRLIPSLPALLRLLTTPGQKDLERLASDSGYRVHHFFNVESPKAIIFAALAATIARALGGRYSVDFVGGSRQPYLDRRRSPWALLFRGALSGGLRSAEPREGRKPVTAAEPGWRGVAI